VLTNAGVYGTVSSVDREHDRLVLKVDEGSNTKLTFTLGSISRVLTDTDTGEAEGGRA